jgi:hypothetical protein
VRHSDRVPIDTPSSWSRAERQEPPRPCQGIKAQAYRHEGLAAAWATTWKALIEWGHTNGVDWLIGRTLPSLVSKLGLGRPQAKTDVQNIRGRDRGALYFRLFLAEVRDRVVDSGRLDAATFDAASGLLDDPDYWTQCWMMTAVWARKPAA